MSLNKNFFMKSTIRFILAFLIINLTFVREGAALESGDFATSLWVQNLLINTEETRPRGLTFSNDGTKMFVIGEEGNNTDSSGDGQDDMHEYTLSTPFDISTASYVDSLANVGDAYETSIKFNNDGSKMFVTGRGNNTVREYSLTANFDLSSATFESFFSVNSDDGTLFGLDFNNDGTMMYITGHENDTIHQYELAVGFDLSDVTFLRSQDLSTQSITPSNIEFNTDGTRMFIIGTSEKTVNQYDLSTGFDISTLSHVGFLDLSSEESLPYGLAFSPSGLKMFITGSSKKVSEYNLNCPFTLFSGNCPSITENSIRTGIAIAQIEVATRTIEHSTDTALNRLKWIRRNKDNQNLTNLNLDLNFTNQMLASLTKVVNTSATTKKKEEKQQDVFYWSEGSIAVGRVGDTNISSFKKIGTEAITLGADKFTDNNGIKGLAFRFGANDVDVGMGGSGIDTETFNLTYYSTTPLENDTKSEDIIIGFGKLDLDILTVLDGKHIKANRNGRQVYFTNKFKDEIKKDNFILIPSFQADVGHTILDGYTESGSGAIKVEDQNIQTLKLRTAMGVVDDLSNETTFCPGIKNKTCFIKRHGKIEYMADLSRSSNFEYTYVSDQTQKFHEKLYSGALHNVNGEIGIDIILPDNLSVFLIYERNQALGTGHTDNIIITIGYLPNKKTNYAFNLEGSENIGSEYKISKNINDFEIDFKLKNQNALKPNTVDEAFINLIRKF